MSDHFIRMLSELKVPLLIHANRGSSAFLMKKPVFCFATKPVKLCIVSSIETFAKVEKKFGLIFDV